MQDNNPTFNFNYNYTYSLKETAEIERIRDKYRLLREESDFEQLKKLDRATCRRARLTAFFICLCAAVLIGVGICLICIRGGSAILGKGITRLTVTGIVLVIAGAITALMAYPIYKKILRHDKRIAAPRILAISAKLLEK